MRLRSFRRSPWRASVAGDPRMGSSAAPVTFESQTMVLQVEAGQVDQCASLALEVSPFHWPRPSVLLPVKAQQFRWLFLFGQLVGKPFAEWSSRARDEYER